MPLPLSPAESNPAFRGTRATGLQAGSDAMSLQALASQRRNRLENNIVIAMGSGGRAGHDGMQTAYLMLC